MNLLSPEVTRKVVHLSSLVMPILYCFTNQNFMIMFLAVIFILITIWDLLRIYSNISIVKFTQKLLLREREGKSFSGGFFFSLACFLAVIFYSKYLFMLSVCILIISDTFAALIGINFGRNKLLNKSVEGATAFFVSGVIVILIVNLIFKQQLFSFSLLIALIFTTIAELFASKLKIDDNLLIIMVFGVTYEVMIALLA